MVEWIQRPELWDQLQYATKPSIVYTNRSGPSPFIPPTFVPPVCDPTRHARIYVVTFEMMP